MGLKKKILFTLLMVTDHSYGEIKCLLLSDQVI